MSRPAKSSTDYSLPDPAPESALTLLTRAELEQLIALLYMCRRVRLAPAARGARRERRCRVRQRDQWCRAGIRGTQSARYPETLFG